MTPDIQCEFQVMNWGESATSGAWVKFWLAPEDLDAFRAIQCRSGKSAGQRFMGVLVEIGDDELPVAPRSADIPAQQADTVAADTVSRVEAEKPVGGDLARLAGMFCQRPEFRAWLRSVGYSLYTEGEAVVALREMCGIRSRAELDHNPDAAEVFHESIRKPFAAWCRARGIA